MFSACDADDLHGGYFKLDNIPSDYAEEIVIAGRFSVKVAISFWKKAAAYGATLFWLSPSMLLMIDKLDRSKIGEDYCRNHDTCFLIGTAALTDKVREKIEKRYAVRLRASYGLSELLFISVETEETRKRGEKNNVGEFLEGVEYKLEADKELLIRVPWEYLDIRTKTRKITGGGNIM